MLGGREFQTKAIGRSQQGTERRPVCPAHGVGVECGQPCGSWNTGAG